jgi:hypothetical protein
LKNAVFWGGTPCGTDISEELSTSIIRVTRIGELGTMLAVTSNQHTLHHIPEDGILHSHRRENLILHSVMFIVCFGAKICKLLQ